MKYDAIVVGSGFTGSVVARKLAEDYNKKVLVVERRKSISGNMYDEYDQYGILIQKYGPHVFHTNNKEVYEYVSKFCDWIPYEHSSKVKIDGVILDSPFNFNTIDKFYSEKDAQNLKNVLKKYYGEQEIVTVIELLENPIESIQEYGKFLFEKDYRPYTAKQWGISPEEIDVSVLKRCPVFLSYRTRYLNEAYECMPKEGFYKLFCNMLDHPNIQIQTDKDILDSLEIDFTENNILYDGETLDIPVIYTGAIDELLGYKFGALPYRSLKFEWKYYDMKSYQEASIVTYPQEKGFTRITEYTKMPIQDVGDKTVIAIEYPIPFRQDDETLEPYYPVINDENNMLYEKYLEITSKINNLIVCGRLGDYKYYNMDQSVARALEVVDLIGKRYR